MIYRILCLIICYEHFYFCTRTLAENHIYRIPLYQQTSTLKMAMNYTNNRMKSVNLKKTQPTNENITLFKYLDSEYYAEILVGKPGQKFKVIFDTTWNDMWIPSKLCSKELYPICSTKSLYDSNASSTHKSIDSTSFDVAGLVGNLTCDTVRLAHLNVTDLIFAEIREIHNVSDYSDMHADGIIGLGFNTFARTTKKTFFYKLLADKKIKNAVFSLYINRDSTTQKGGIIFLGGINQKHIDGEITYVPVTLKNFWQIEMNQFSINLNKTHSKTFCNPTCQVILDSGSNKIGVPKEDVVILNGLIGAVKYFQNRYRVPCSKVKKLPTITLNFGNRDFHISGRNYVQQIEDETHGLICITAFCQTYLTDGTWSLGGGFLSSVYTIFDLENNRVGLAHLKSG